MRVLRFKSSFLGPKITLKVQKGDFGTTLHKTMHQSPPLRTSRLHLITQNKGKKFLWQNHKMLSRHYYYILTTTNAPRYVKKKFCNWIKTCPTQKNLFNDKCIYHDDGETNLCIRTTHTDVPFSLVYACHCLLAWNCLLNSYNEKF